MTNQPVLAIVTDPLYWRVGSPRDVVKQIVSALAHFGIPTLLCAVRSGDEAEAGGDGPEVGLHAQERLFSSETERQVVADLVAGRTLSGVRNAYFRERGEAPLVIGVGSAFDDLWLLNQVDIPFVVRSAWQPPPPRHLESAWVAVEDLPDGLRSALGEALDGLWWDVVLKTG